MISIEKIENGKSLVRGAIVGKLISVFKRAYGERARKDIEKKEEVTTVTSRSSMQNWSCRKHYRRQVSKASQSSLAELSYHSSSWNSLCDTL